MLFSSVLHFFQVPTPFSFFNCISTSYLSSSSSSVTKQHLLVKEAAPTFLCFVCFLPSMEAEQSGRRNSNSNSNAQLLEELEVLSQSLYETHTRRTRAASFALPPTIPAVSSSILTDKTDERTSRSRRMSLSSPWRIFQPKPDDENEQKDRSKVLSRQEIKMNDDVKESLSAKKKGIWNWKPIRALMHIGMQRISCLFSVDVVSVQGLPATMNGLRVSVCVRKKETKDGAVQTMPARVLQGTADFEETLFLKCHVYCNTTTTTTNGSVKQLKFESRPFLVYVFAVDAQELDFGRSYVDLSHLVQDSMEKSMEGDRVRQWNASYDLSGKAKGGQLVLKLGFQMMEKDGRLGIYGQAAGGLKSGTTSSSSRWDYLPSFARKQSKSSFSVPSQRMSIKMETLAGKGPDYDLIDDMNLDGPAPIPSSSPSLQKSKEPESKIEELSLLEFEVVDKGVEVEYKTDAKEGTEDSIHKMPVSSEVVKEVTEDQVHYTRLKELDLIAQRIRTLETMMEDENSIKAEEETKSESLDTEEEIVTKEFLNMLEVEEEDERNELRLDGSDNPILKLKEAAEEESKVFLPDLGKGLGCVAQTKDGGYLVSINPFDIELTRTETPKLAMQVSKPLILLSKKSMSGLQIYQRMTGIGLEELSSEILSLMPMDELTGKTAEQVAFEGIAAAIIQGRNKEGASSMAARTIAAVKTMATSMCRGRKERISSGSWNVPKEAVTMDEILALSMQKIEAMAVEALKIQADIAEEDAPYDISPLVAKTDTNLNRPLASCIPLEEWLKKRSLESSEGEIALPTRITLSMGLQLRDPLRRYEAVGGPMVALVQATRAEATEGKDDEERFKLVSLHLGGLKIRAGVKRHVWDAEKQRLTAMLWLEEYGLGKAGKKGKNLQAKEIDSFWSISSRVMAEMWLKHMRNPDIKSLTQQ